jgi:hypothetical protein
MAKSSKKSRRQEPPAPLAAPVPRNAARNGGSEAADSARPAHRLRQIVAVLEKRETYPPDALVQLQMRRRGNGRCALAAEGGKGKFSSRQSLEKSRNQKILGSPCSRD